jgi:hypothetical protein
MIFSGFFGFFAEADEPKKTLRSGSAKNSRGKWYDESLYEPHIRDTSQ